MTIWSRLLNAAIAAFVVICVWNSLGDFASAELPEGYDVDGRSLKPFLTGRSDTHREYVFACIGETRLVRTRTHLLEVVSPILNMPRGRFYFCGTSHDGDGSIHPADRQALSEVGRRLRKDGFP